MTQNALRPDSSRSELERAMICSLPSVEFRERRVEIQSFLERCTAIAELADGVELQFAVSSETAHALLDFILFERVCCASLSYELRSQPDPSMLTLRLTGPPAQVKALKAMYLPTT